MKNVDIIHNLSFEVPLCISELSLDDYKFRAACSKICWIIHQMFMFLQDSKNSLDFLHLLKNANYRLFVLIMQTRLRGIKSVLGCTKRLLRPCAPVRVFSAQAAQAQDVYEHVSNMKTKDLFQFEPFNEEDLLVCYFLP